jgi:hypothetical protein
MAEIYDVVRATGSVASGAGGDRADFGNYLFLTQDRNLDATGSGRVLQAAELGDITGTFVEGTEPYRGAASWFAQDPYPRGYFLIARWAAEAVSSQLVGGPVMAIAMKPATAAISFTAIPRSGGAAQTANLASLDLSAANTYADIGAALQAAIRTTSGAVFNNITVTYDAARGIYILEIPYGDGDFNAAATGTNANFFGLNTATFTAGTEAESASVALEDIETYLPGFTFIGADNSIAEIQSAVEALSTYAAANRKQLMLDMTGDAALITNDAVSLPAAIAGRQSRYDGLVWKENIDYTAVAVAARFSAVNWTGVNTLPDGKFIRCPGHVIDPLTRPQRDELTRKRINFFTNYGARNLIAEGVTCAPGYWLDTQIFLLWYLDAVQSDVFGAIADAVSARMTPAGINIARSAARGVCDEAVRNGGFAKGGRIRHAALIDEIKQATGNDAFDGVLPTGYLIHIDPIANISAADAAERIMPEMRIWAVGSGAIHFVNIAVTISE